MFLDKKDKSQFKPGMLVRFMRPKDKGSRCSGCILEVSKNSYSDIVFLAKKPSVTCGRIIGQPCHILNHDKDYEYNTVEDIVTGVLSIDEQGI